MGKFKIITLIGIFLLILTTITYQQKKEDVGFVSIFDGKTLNGWTFMDGRDDGHGWVVEKGDNEFWKASNGILENTGEGKASYIWTKKEYGDFVLRLEWRLPGKSTEKLRDVYDYNGELIQDENGKRVRNKVIDAGDSGVILRGIGNAQVNIWSNPMGSGQVQHLQL